MKSIIIAGFATFSMFFGSGNLVFPLILGQKIPYDIWEGMIGWFIGAVGIPLIGLIGMIRSGGSFSLYFRELGPHMTFFLKFLILALIGPFGVIPRCTTVACGGLGMTLPWISLPIGAFIFLGSVGLCFLFQKRIVDVIGIFLTPFKLGGIVLLICVGLYMSAPIPLPNPADAGLCCCDIFDRGWEAMKLGCSMGYQTMDLLAALFFGGTILSYFKGKKNYLKDSLKSSAIAAFLLCLVYGGFLILASRYHLLLEGVQPEKMLLVIAGKTFGSYAYSVVGFTLFFSCLATATILSDLWNTFMSNELFKNKLSKNMSLILTLGISYGLALLGFANIMSFLGKILTWIYPLLLVFACYKLFKKKDFSVM